MKLKYLGRTLIVIGLMGLALAQYETFKIKQKIKEVEVFKTAYDGYDAWVCLENDGKKLYFNHQEVKGGKVILTKPYKLESDIR